MPTPQTKLIGIEWHVNLDPEGDNVDLGADITALDLGGFERILHDANTLGYDVMRKVHGAWNFPVSMTIQQRANWGLWDLFKDYLQGDPPFWGSFEIWKASAAVGANNQKLHLMDGTTGNLPIGNISWNTVSELTLTWQFERVGLNDADDAACVDIKDGSTALTHIADAAPA